MRTLQSAHDATHLPHRHGHDAGPAAASSRFFSRNTARLADRFPDIAWPRALGAAAASLAALAVGAAGLAGALSPALVIGGAVAALMTLRVLAFKIAGLLGR